LFDIPLRKAIRDFSVVEQSARLASRFVECGVLDRVFLSIANEGKPGRSWQRRGIEGEVGLEISKEQLDKKEPTDGAKAQELLIHLSKTISFCLDDTVQCDALTNAIPNKKYRDRQFPNAEKSKVRIARRQYDDLKNAKGTEDTPCLLYLQVNFATTLVHEIGHALDNMAHGRLYYPHFLGENMIWEPGFDVETRLFGGYLTTHFDSEADVVIRYKHNGRSSELTGILVLWEYPTQGLVETYRSDGTMETRGEPKDVRSLDIAWRVPIAFLKRLFRDSFWNDQLPSDANALRPQCSVGYCFRVDQHGESIPVATHRSDGKMLYVPEGYRRLPDGSIEIDHRKKHEFGFVDTTKFWEDKAREYSTDEGKRPWVVLPDRAANTHRLCKEYL
jgi:hypothetical protein